MNFGQAIATCFQKYAQFRGYASRPEYWWWVLFVVAIGLVARGIDSSQHTTVISSIWSLAVLLPGLAVLVRRLRDAGYHWAWVFIALVPIVGAIVLIVLTCQPTKARVTVPVPTYLDQY